MVPLVDAHCHLLAGLDDGPATEEEALAMVRIAYAEGVRTSLATAHQNARWSTVTPDRIRQAARDLASLLHRAEVPVTVFPGAEVMVHPDVEASWQKGELLSVADRKQYLLVEMPHGLFVDLRATVANFRNLGVRPILAHPERQPELLHEPGQVEQLIEAGCLVQVNAASVTEPRSARDERALKQWFRRGVVHLAGSDGHSTGRRRPLMREAYHRVARWAGINTADRVFSTNGIAVLHGLPLRIAPPPPPRAGWVARFFRG